MSETLRAPFPWLETTKMKCRKTAGTIDWDLLVSGFIWLACSLIWIDLLIVSIFVWKVLLTGAAVTIAIIMALAVILCFGSVITGWHL